MELQKLQDKMLWSILYFRGSSILPHLIVTYITFRKSTYQKAMSDKELAMDMQ